jgi:HEAT repeat protein
MGGDRAPEILAFLLPFLEDKDEQLRGDVAQVLEILARRVELDASQGISALVKLLRDESPQVRLAAVKALGAIVSALPPDAPRRDFVAALAPVARDRDVQVRMAAFPALSACNAKEAIPLFLQSLQDERPLVREWAVAELGRAARNGDKEVLPVLTRLLQDQDSQVRRAAAFGFGSVAPEAVWDAVHDKACAIRADAARGLGARGPDADRFTKVLPTLRKFLKDPDSNVQAAAVQGLDKSMLNTLAADQDPDVAWVAAHELAVRAKRPNKIEVWEKEHHGERSGK